MTLASYRLYPSLAAGLLLLAGPLRAQDAAPAATTPAEPKIETLVFVRHGEKPDDDEGQLTVQGFNRALALPDVLIGKFGTASDVPEWPDEDFDSIFIVRLRTDAQGRRSVSFEHDLERLNGQSAAFPAPAAKP